MDGKREYFIFVFSMVLVSFLASMFLSFLIVKEKNWIIVLGTSFGTLYGAIIWLRHFSEKKHYEGNGFVSAGL